MIIRGVHWRVLQAFMYVIRDLCAALLCSGGAQSPRSFLHIGIRSLPTLFPAGRFVGAAPQHVNPGELAAPDAKEAEGAEAAAGAGDAKGTSAYQVSLKMA